MTDLDRMRCLETGIAACRWIIRTAEDAEGSISGSTEGFREEHARNLLQDLQSGWERRFEEVEALHRCFAEWAGE